MVDKIEIGKAGELLVAYEIIMRGGIASIPSGNVRNFDIQASSKRGDKSINIQAKTTQTKKKITEWMVSKDAEETCNDNIYYVFVLNRSKNEKEYYVVPSRIVAEY